MVVEYLFLYIISIECLASFLSFLAWEEITKFIGFHIFFCFNFVIKKRDFESLIITCIPPFGVINNTLFKCFSFVFYLLSILHQQDVSVAIVDYWFRLWSILKLCFYLLLWRAHKFKLKVHQVLTMNMMTNWLI